MRKAIHPGSVTRSFDTSARPSCQQASSNTGSSALMYAPSCHVATWWISTPEYRDFTALATARGTCESSSSLAFKHAGRNGLAPGLPDHQEADGRLRDPQQSLQRIPSHKPMPHSAAVMAI